MLLAVAHIHYDECNIYYPVTCSSSRQPSFKPILRCVQHIMYTLDKLAIWQAHMHLLNQPASRVSGLCCQAMRCSFSAAMCAAHYVYTWQAHTYLLNQPPATLQACVFRPTKLKLYAGIGAAVACCCAEGCCIVVG